VVNARIVGGPETVAGSVRKLWKPGMKLIVVTYCQNSEEQADVYDRIYEICGQAKPA
jgi:alkanesulfonate monooxygenase SsuD/methylene tetrahydromethanopterin reductase-like flavin-dependent oxidoreductase (luciferase family)